MFWKWRQSINVLIYDFFSILGHFLRAYAVLCTSGVALYHLKRKTTIYVPVSRAGPRFHVKSQSWFLLCLTVVSRSWIFSSQFTCSQLHNVHVRSYDLSWWYEFIKAFSAASCKITGRPITWDLLRRCTYRISSNKCWGRLLIFSPQKGVIIPVEAIIVGEEGGGGGGAVIGILQKICHEMFYMYIISAYIQISCNILHCSINTIGLILQWL